MDPKFVADLKTFVDNAKKDGSILYSPELDFLREWILYGLHGTLPTRPVEPEPMEEDEPDEEPPRAEEQEQEKPGSEEEESESEEEEEEEEEESLELDELDAAVIPPENEFGHLKPDLNKEITDEMRDAAIQAKLKGVELMAAGDLDHALEQLNNCVQLNPQSALNIASRAQCYMKLKKPRAAIEDCTTALEINPNSAKGFRIRGMAHSLLGDWEKAWNDINNSIQLDYDPELVDLQKKLLAKHNRLMDKRRKEAAKKRRRLEKERRRAARKEAKRKAKEARDAPPEGSGFGGIPGMFGTGGPGGAAGGGVPADLFQKIMQDPELAALLQDPEVMAAATAMSSDPSKINSYLGNPKVMSFIEKASKLMGQ